MQALQRVGEIALVISMFVVGVRLLRVAVRTRELPEFSIGVTFICSGAVPALIAMAFLGPDIADETQAARGNAASLLSLAVGSAMLFEFTRRVFRADTRWATVLARTAIVVYAVGLVGQALNGGFVRMVDGGPWYYSGLLARLVGFGWASVEALRYGALMRRRQRIGLAEPLVVHQLFLWGIASGAAFCSYLVTVAHMVVHSGAYVPPSLPEALFSQTMGLTCAFAIWCAFFPPAFYRRWIGAGASQA